MKMSRSNKIKVACGIALMAALIVVAAAGPRLFKSVSRGFVITAAGEFSTGGSWTSLQENRIDAEQVSSVQIATDAEDVVLVPSDSDKVVVREETHAKDGAKTQKTEGLCDVADGVLNISYAPASYPDGELRRVTVELPRSLAKNVAIQASLGSGDMSVQGLTLGTASVTTDTGDIEFEGGVRDALSVQTSSGDYSFKLDKQAPTQMNVVTECGDGDISVPADTGFTARVTLGSGSFSSDFDDREYDAEGIYEFPNGAGSASYAFGIDSGDLTLGKL